MRKIFIFLAMIAFCSCSKNDRLIYDPEMHDIYYSIVTDKQDSVYVSLLGAEEMFTTKLNVKMLGDVLSSPAKFKVQVVKDKTDAIEGVHYEKLPEYFEFPAGVFEYKLPVSLLKGDQGITEKPVCLTLQLVGTSDLGIAYPDRSVVRLIIADMLKKPQGDTYYGDMTAFKALFGEYSRKKHEMIIGLAGHDFWDGSYGTNGGAGGLYNERNYYVPYARKLYKIIMETETKDENGKIIQGWLVP